VTETQNAATEGVAREDAAAGDFEPARADINRIYQVPPCVQADLHKRDDDGIRFLTPRAGNTQNAQRQSRRVGNPASTHMVLEVAKRYLVAEKPTFRNHYFLDQGL